MELSRALQIRTGGLPSCPITALYAESPDAAKTCAASLVGHGTVDSEVTLPGKPPVNVEGQMSAFYDYGEGQPRILAQVIGDSAMPLTYVIPFTIYPGAGAFPTVLSVEHMQFIEGICAPGYSNCFSQTYTYEGIYGHISRFELTLDRSYAHAGRRVSLVNADCPARSTARSTVLPLVRVELSYRELLRSSQTTSQRCEVLLRPRG